MSFTYSAIGDNTPENREHLEKIGYKKWMWDDDDYDIPFISTMLESKKYAAFTQDEVDGFENDIDCRSNPALFQAVSTVRDDIDEEQWFTDGKEWIFCDREDWIDMYSVLCSGGRYNYNKNGELDKFWKPTLEELINHFKK